MDNRDRGKLTRQKAIITGKRWCADHQGEHDANDGQLRQRGKRPGMLFTCNPCLRRKGLLK